MQRTQRSFAKNVTFFCKVHKRTRERFVLLQKKAEHSILLSSLHFTSKKLYSDILTVHNKSFKLFSKRGTIIHSIQQFFGGTREAGFYFFNKPPPTPVHLRPPAFIYFIHTIRVFFPNKRDTRNRL